MEMIVIQKVIIGFKTLLKFYLLLGVCVSRKDDVPCLVLLMR